PGPMSPPLSQMQKVTPSTSVTVPAPTAGDGGPPLYPHASVTLASPGPDGSRRLSPAPPGGFFLLPRPFPHGRGKHSAALAGDSPRSPGNAAEASQPGGVPRLRVRAAAVPRRGDRSQGAAPGAGVAGAARSRQGGSLDDDADPRLVEREGQARARLAACRAKLAGRLCSRADPIPAGDHGCRRAENAGRKGGRGTGAAAAAAVLDRLPDARQR